MWRAHLYFLATLLTMAGVPVRYWMDDWKSTKKKGERGHLWGTASSEEERG